MTDNSTGKEDDFDLDLWLGKMRKAGGSYVGRKLSFEEQCAAFACLYGGARNAIIARAFGLSKTSVSYLAGCLQYDPTPTRSRLVFRDGQPVEETFARDHNHARNPARAQRYETVAREFEALGEAEFNRRYLTADMRQRVVRATHEIIKENGRVPLDGA